MSKKKDKKAKHKLKQSEQQKADNVESKNDDDASGSTTAEALPAVALGDDLVKQKEVDKLLTSFGDSSDEDDGSVLGYDIATQIQKFYAKQTQELYAESDDDNSAASAAEAIAQMDSKDVLSFITHAAGIYTLYSQAVKAKYYELKREKLKISQSDIVVIGDKELEGQINKTCEERGRYAGRNQSRQDLESVVKVAKEDVSTAIKANHYEYAHKLHRGDYTWLWSYNPIHGKFAPHLVNDGDPYFGKLIATLRDHPVNNFAEEFNPPNILKNFKSKTLDQPDFDLSATTPENFVVEFFAHLRLHNRSAKRHIKNHEKFKDTSWKIISQDDVLAVKLNNQKDMAKYSDERDEVVKFKGDGSGITKYRDIFSTPVSEVDASTLLDCRINIKQAEPTSLNHNLLSLWYLLFGCETIKNPANIIHVNMVMDLAKDGTTFKEVLWKKIPMTAHPIIKKAMGLNKKYTDFMPHKYSYQPGESFSTENLHEKEAEIAKEWLEHKVGKSVSKYLIDQSTKDPAAVKTIWGLILESFEGWGLPNPDNQPADVSIAGASTSAAAASSYDASIPNDLE